jgi:hypothetical protein
MMENIIQGYSGTGAKGIRIASGAIPGINVGCSFYNNTTNADSGTVYEHEVETEADDPLVDAAGGDFVVEVASEAYHASHIGPCLMSRGACQEEPAGGGGNGTMGISQGLHGIDSGITA